MKKSRIAQLGTTGVAGSVTIGLEDAAGDGITDDTDALNKALNHSNCVIDGGNRRYKYLSIVILSAIIAGAVTLIGVLIANSKSNAVMEYKIEELTREVRKHNGFAEKIPVIQRDIQVLNHRMTDIETHEHERS